MPPESPAVRLLSLNRQAIALLRLGIPLKLGLGSDTTERLREINERLAGDTGPPDETIDKFLVRQQFPKDYDSFARMLLTCDEPREIFRSNVDPVQGQDRMVKQLNRAISEPLIVISLAYLGMLLMCTYMMPHVQAQYDQSSQTPTGITAALLAVREWMPIWGIGVPVGLIAFLTYWQLSGARSLSTLLPGYRTHKNWLRSATQARRLASLVQGGMDVDSAIALARGPAGSSPPLGPLAERMAREAEQSQRAGALTKLSQFYRFLADDRRKTALGKTPAMFGILFSGIIVLGYALAIFLPWLQVLTGIAEAGGAP